MKHVFQPLRFKIADRNELVSGPLAGLLLRGLRRFLSQPQGQIEPTPVCHHASGAFVLRKIGILVVEIDIIWLICLDIHNIFTNVRGEEIKVIHGNFHRLARMLPLVGALQETFVCVPLVRAKLESRLLTALNLEL